VWRTIVNRRRVSARPLPNRACGSPAHGSPQHFRQGHTALGKLGWSTVLSCMSVSHTGTHPRRSSPRTVLLQGLPSPAVLLSAGSIGTMPRSDSLWVALALPRRVSPVPCTTLPAFHVLYAGGFLVGALPRSSPRPWAFALWDQARLPLVLCMQRSLTARQTSHYAADCRFAQPPSEAFVSGLRRRPFGRPRPEPGTSSPLSYAAAGTLPRPDSHR